MTYDRANGYSTHAGFDAPMRTDPADPTPDVIKRWNSCTSAVDYCQLHGVPGDQIVFGMPFFSHAFIVSATENNGFYQPVAARRAGGLFTAMAAPFL